MRRLIFLVLSTFFINTLISYGETKEPVADYNSLPSEVQQAHIPTPGNFRVARQQDGMVILTWDKLEEPSVLGYQIKLWFHDNGSILAEIPDPNVTSYVHRDGQIGTDYVYALCGYGGARPTIYSEPTTALSYWIEPPRSISAAPGDGMVKLTWDKAAEPWVAGYDIYRSSVTSDGVDRRFVAEIRDIRAASFIDTDVESGELYYYEFVMFDNAFPPNTNSARLEGVRPRPGLEGEPLKIWIEPGAYFQAEFNVNAGVALRFYVTAKDADSAGVFFKPVILPPGAVFTPPANLPRHNTAAGYFEWTPYNADARDEPYVINFEAQNSEGETANIEIKVNVLRPESVIAIELNETSWDLTDVKLGDTRINTRPGEQIVRHTITNKGNVAIRYEIGYAPLTGGQIIHPGTRQDLDTFITLFHTGVNVVALPTDGGKAQWHDRVMPDESAAVLLMFGAPTEVSGNAQTMSVTCEIRAYPAR